MAVSIRLDDELERELERTAESEGLSKSELVRRCLKEYIAHRKMASRPWDLGKDLFGRCGSGRSDRSQSRKRILREKLHAKKDRR